MRIRVGVLRPVEARAAGLSAACLGVLLLVAPLTGCVTVAEHRALEREVVNLKTGGGGPPGSATSRVAELGSQVEELRDQVTQLRGELEEVRHQADQALQEAEALRRESASREDRTRRADRAGASSSPAPGDTVGGAQSGDITLQGNPDEVRSYEEAFRLYRTGDYPAAIDRFGAFLQTHPSSEYADNALFWLGECHFKLGDHEKAVLAFDDVVKRFPDGNKVPDALYRQGIALLEIGKQTGQETTYRAAAQEIFQQLVTNHPDSERVPEARRQLENQAR